VYIILYFFTYIHKRVCAVCVEVYNIIVLRAIIVMSSRVCLPRRRRRRGFLNIITTESESLRSIRAQAGSKEISTPFSEISLNSAGTERCCIIIIIINSTWARENINPNDVLHTHRRTNT